MSDATTKTIWRWEQGGNGVRTLWFDQPGRQENTLNDATLDELEARLVEIDNDRSVTGLVLRSAKPAGFCAGADFENLLALRTRSDAEAFSRRGLAVFDHLANLTVPTVAVIHGSCFGGGLELALACSRRMAVASAAPLQLGMPEVHFGLIPIWGGIARIPRIIGPDDGLRLLITGRAIGYLLARSLGFVARLASEGDTIESMNLLSSKGQDAPTWSQQAWEDSWDHARETLDAQPGEHPQAQLQILTIAAIELAQGSDAARDAAVKAAAEMIVSDSVRDYLTDMVERGDDSRSVLFPRD